MHRPEARSHTLAQLSPLAVTSRFALELNSTWLTGPLWCKGGRAGLPLANSHTTAEPSLLPSASRPPSALNWAQRTRLRFVPNRLKGFTAITSQTEAPPERPSRIASLPSGLKTVSYTTEDVVRCETKGSAPARSHKWTVGLWLATSTWRPSGLNEALPTWPLCLIIPVRGSPVSALQSRRLQPVLA